MRHIYRTITRLECLSPKNLYSPKRSKSLLCKNRVFCTQTFEQDTAEMGKDKVPYQLKTPKGTKDCIYPSSTNHLVRR